MKITAIMPVRNEAWVLGLSARALLLFCDELIIFNHFSSDRTLDILHEIQGEDKRLVYFTGTDPVWKEMEHRQRLLQSARERGATHIVTIDADEMVCANMVHEMREVVLNMPPGRILQLPWIQLRGGIDRYISTGMWANNRASTAFPDRPDLHWAAQNGYDHHHRHPMGTAPLAPWQGLMWKNCGLMHLQMMSERRLLAKHAWYKMMERIRWPEKPVKTIDDMYSLTVRECQSASTSAAPESWWEPYFPLMKHLDLDAEPWQIAEVKRLWAEHGAAKFAGLDLYGVIEHEKQIPDATRQDTKLIYSTRSDITLSDNTRLCIQQQQHSNQSTGRSINRALQFPRRGPSGRRQINTSRPRGASAGIISPTGR